MTKEVKVDLMLRYLELLESNKQHGGVRRDVMDRIVAVCDAIDAELGIPKTQVER